mgnify:CR=1 FL=1
MPFPTALLTSSTLINLGLKIARRYGQTEVPDITPAQVRMLCAELRRIKRKYGHYELVEVISADGETVRITL